MILPIGRSNFVVRCGQCTIPASPAGWHNTKYAFTLVEVMISVAILSVALVLILQALAHSLNILRITEDNLAAALIAGNKMAESQILAKEDWDSFKKGVYEKFTVEDIKCQWTMDVASVEGGAEELAEGNEELNEVNAFLSWKEGKRKGVISLATYMRSPVE